MRCAEVGWEARSRPDHPAEAARPASSIVLSALARSSARPWSEANRSAANSPCRLIAASTVGQSTAANPTKASTPPTVQETRCGLRIDAPSSIVEPVAAGNDVSEGHAATSRAPAATSAGCPTWIEARVRLMPDNTLASPQRTPLRSEAAGRRAGPLLQPRLPPPRQGYRPLHR
jgi:hypothetical protein